MQHTIKTEQQGTWSKPMTNAIEKCVHCGFCLPACPTYQTMGEEMDSPRGRIYIMKEVLEGNVEIDDAMRYIDRCLGCLGCVTACPSGVEYGELLTPFRAEAEAKRKRTFGERLLRKMILSSIPYPSRFRLAMKLAKLATPVSRFLPKRFQPMFDLVPQFIPAKSTLPDVYPAEGKLRARVALLVGCAQQVIAPEINRATLRVLARNGIETIIPKSQTCCGAIAAHTGAMDVAKVFATANLRAFPQDVDAIVTNAAGCGSGIHEYALWLKGTEHEEAAKQFVTRSQDVSVFLSEIGMSSPEPLSRKFKLAYHDACHLAHAQRVKSQPRQLLDQIENLELKEIESGEMCCGSAGTYNIEQPEAAGELGNAKASAIVRTDADMVATGNIGCMTQIEMHLRKRGNQIPVLHTMQVLDLAYQKKLLIG